VNAALIVAMMLAQAPEESLRILNSPAMQSNVTHHPVPLRTGTRPKSITIHSSPGASSWLSFPATSPPRRLDGTLLSQPITVYAGADRSRGRRR
jgi:hypothetical protein